MTSRCAMPRVATQDVLQQEHPGQPIRLLIVDSQPRVRNSLEALLTGLSGSMAQPAGCPLEVVGLAEDGEQAVDQVRVLQPDVVLMDPGSNAASAAGAAVSCLAAIGIIKRSWPAVRLVALALHSSVRAPALAAGADAFLLKGCPTNELWAAVLPKKVVRPEKVPAGDSRASIAPTKIR